MLLVFVLCAGIFDPAPGCREHRVPLVVDVIPTACATKAQEVLAERPELHGGAGLARFTCARRRPVAG